MYKESLKTLKKVVRKNHNLSREEWDRFARLNNYYSSTTLEAHTNSTFKQLKGDILWF